MILIIAVLQIVCAIILCKIANDEVKENEKLKLVNEKLCKENEQLRLEVFILVRNNQILHEATKLKKSEKEITDMTKAAMKSLKYIFDFKAVKELYEL